MQELRANDALPYMTLDTHRASPARAFVETASVGEFRDFDEEGSHALVVVDASGHLASFVTSTDLEASRATSGKLLAPRAGSQRENDPSCR